MTPPNIGYELRTRDLAGQGDRGVHRPADHRGECLSKIAALMRLVEAQRAGNIQMFSEIGVASRFTHQSAAFLT